MAMKEMICPGCKYKVKVKEDVKLTTHGCPLNKHDVYVMVPVSEYKETPTN